MRKLKLFILVIMISFLSSESSAKSEYEKIAYDFAFNDLDGSLLKLSEFKDKIIVHEFEKYNQYNLVYKHRSINNDILIKLKNLAYRKFYFNIRNFFIIFLSFASFLRK